MNIRAAKSIQAQRVATILVTCLVWTLSAGRPCAAVETVAFTLHGTHREVSGKVLVEAADGGMLLEGPDRQIWVLQPADIERRASNDEEFTYATRAEVEATVLRELPPGFKVHNTAHYMICYNTTRAYAQWCGALYERLYGAYFNFWRKRGLKLTEPDFLVSIVFRDGGSYATYGQPEVGDAVASVIGFYSPATNRIATQDLTGIEQVRQPGDRTGSLRHINAILSRPGAERTVATLIHEATHQLAFNSGLQVRYADNPLWLCEGLAIYFEAPDLSSNKGWRKIGAMHPLRLQTWRANRAARPADALLRLLTDDSQFRQVATAEQAYSEAWALCYYLINQRSDEFRNYLTTIGQKPVLSDDSPETRVQEFQQAFGGSWRDIDASWRRAADSWR
ncbi:MAG: DUF1570 domain-containing protein [Planctomycetales bacterium]|nr:DUF1570 domain-containing protein [Planctomycetales bacterium]